ELAREARGDRGAGRARGDGRAFEDGRRPETHAARQGDDPDGHAIEPAGGVAGLVPSAGGWELWRRVRRETGADEAARVEATGGQAAGCTTERIGPEQPVAP